MSLETIIGNAKVRISPQNPAVVQIQRKHGGRWERLKSCNGADEARRAILWMAQNRTIIEGEGEQG